MSKVNVMKLEWVIKKADGVSLSAALKEAWYIIKNQVKELSQSICKRDEEKCCIMESKNNDTWCTLESMIGEVFENGVDMEEEFLLNISGEAHIGDNLVDMFDGLLRYEIYNETESYFVFVYRCEESYKIDKVIKNY